MKKELIALYGPYISDDDLTAIAKNSIYIDGEISHNTEAMILVCKNSPLGEAYGLDVANNLIAERKKLRGIQDV